MQLLQHGLGFVPVALAINRITVGTFFVLSGYQKLFKRNRHDELLGTLQADGVHFIRITQWLIPSAEFAGGLALVSGTLSVIAAVGLMVILVGALCLDGIKRIAAWKPLDRVDWLDDLLYLPETPYLLALLLVVLAGPGALAVDSLW
ncbi:MAG TPA: DoxX family protein [Casimicrobiaceae bacterium]|nr:DoxX family protein [Casimicrobiaceae bacterium]